MSDAVLDQAPAHPDTVNNLTLSPDTVNSLTHTDPPESVHSLSRKQLLHILKLRRIRPDATQAEIAAFVGTTQGTVSRWLAEYHDTVEEAGDYLKASALPAATKAVELIEHADGRIAHAAVRTVLEATKLLNQDAKVDINTHVVLGVSVNVLQQVQASQQLSQHTPEASANSTISSLSDPTRIIE